ncbi:MAG: hypothetical protein KDF64_06915 [Geminicoccaceae bacterium]|nr:hypothetical protein [Geminicoccaceae bacterium]
MENLGIRRRDGSHFPRGTSQVVFFKLGGTMSQIVNGLALATAGVFDPTLLKAVRASAHWPAPVSRGSIGSRLMSRSVTTATSPFTC